jgi:hypothetical protein
VKEFMQDSEERFTKIEEDLKKLFQKTNYEQQKYFKFMYDEIKKHDELINFHANNFEQIQDLMKLKTLHGTSSAVIAIEKEIYPSIKEKIDTNFFSDFLDALQKSVVFEKFTALENEIEETNQGLGGLQAKVVSFMGELKNT